MQRSWAGFGLGVAMLTGSVFAEPKDKGRKLVLDLCMSCHELERVKIQHKNREQWLSTIKGMLSEGAAVTDEEVALVLDYLVKNFGPEDRKETKQ